MLTPQCIPNRPPQKAADPIHLVSVSGGKDSTATLLLALELHGRENVRAAFADTGNEHGATYDPLARVYRRPTAGEAPAT